MAFWPTTMSRPSSSVIREMKERRDPPAWSRSSTSKAIRAATSCSWGVRARPSARTWITPSKYPPEILLHRSQVSPLHTISMRASSSTGTPKRFALTRTAASVRFGLRSREVTRNSGSLASGTSLTAWTASSPASSSRDTGVSCQIAPVLRDPQVGQVMASTRGAASIHRVRPARHLPQRPPAEGSPQRGQKDSRMLMSLDPEDLGVGYAANQNHALPVHRPAGDGDLDDPAAEEVRVRGGGEGSPHPLLVGRSIPVEGLGDVHLCLAVDQGRVQELPVAYRHDLAVRGPMDLQEHHVLLHPGR